jgi:formamidopyrimidine-DNA glycosylase
MRASKENTFGWSWTRRHILWCTLEWPAGWKYVSRFSFIAPKLTTWKFSNDESAYYRPTKPEEAEWPPKYWKFILQLKDSKNEVALVDARRLARVRLVDAAAEDMRKTTPLKENGPDPVIDKDILTVDWLSKKLRSKKVPVKALLLE